MKTFAEASQTVLKNMQNTLTAADTQASTPAHGLTSADGKMITPAPAQGGQAASTNAHALSSPKTTLPSLKDDQQGRTRLNEVILMAFDALKTYGKEPEQLDSVKKLMHFALADYNIQQVREAFAYYFKHNSEFPAPADIVQIIERGNKPPFDRSVYVTISKKQADQRTSAEWAYMRDYEDWNLNG